MAYDGKNVWVTNYTSSTISVVDPNGAVVNTISQAPNANPEGILFDGTYMWVANDGDGSQYRQQVSCFDHVFGRQLSGRCQSRWIRL